MALVAVLLLSRPKFTVRSHVSGWPVALAALRSGTALCSISRKGWYHPST